MNIEELQHQTLENHFLKKSQKDNLEVANKKYKQVQTSYRESDTLKEQKWYICRHLQTGGAIDAIIGKYLGERRNLITFSLTFYL